MRPELIGYTDKFSYRPGDRLRAMVSTDHAKYEATMVRLIHGDENPAGPGFKEQVVDAAVNGFHAGRKQAARSGSCVWVEAGDLLAGLHGFTIAAWIYPTTPTRGRAQGLVTRWSAENRSGYALCVGEKGDLELWLDAPGRPPARISTSCVFRAAEWYFVAASWDPAGQKACLYQWPRADWPEDPSVAETEKSGLLPPGGELEAPLGIGAFLSRPLATQQPVPRDVFNGKIANPCILGRVLGPEEIRKLRRGAAPAELAAEDTLAAWDFAADIPSTRVTDTSRNRLHGSTINMPGRAVTGPNWTGRTVNYREAPAEYGAIHFHEDDLEDAAWEPDFEWEIPAGFRSGVYAIRLAAGEYEDHIPFFVRPAKGTAGARVALLLPTLTYLAYANEHLQFNIDLGKPGVIGRPISPDPLDLCLAEHPEWGLSFYDLHADGSGNCYSTRLRPIINLRPKYRMWLLGAPRGLSADLYLVDWLEQKGFAYDVLTDEDLHHEGHELLSQYRAVITGTHPEYYTANMLDGMESYVRSGGRLLYLGGNGFYWVTAVDTQRPHIFELRRGHAGTRSWEPAAGECYHSTTGEAGGLWRHRGRAPNALVGIGFAAMGWDTTPYGYHRLPGSFDKRARFIFEGIGEQEIIGDFGLVMGGAAGDELDRVDYKLGTPPHCLLLASSGPHGKYYIPVIEDLAQITPSTMEDTRANVRADMTYFETAKGGAVFSVGSISWAGSLSHNDYQNNVSRITENVLRKFLS